MTSLRFNALNRARTATLGAADIALIVFCAAFTSAVQAQPTQAQASAIRQNCRGDYQANCASVPTGGSEALACLQRNAAKISPACQQSLQSISAPVPKPATTSAGPSSSVKSAQASAVRMDWPHVLYGPKGTATVYEPQVISWNEHQTLNARIAVGLTQNGAKTPILGTMEMAFATQTNMATRTVTLTDARLISTRFPSLDTEQASHVEEQIKNAVGNLGVKQIPLDTIMLSLRSQAQKPTEILVKNDPPAIFVSARAASLVVFDGEPVLAPLAGTSLSFVVNTNSDVSFDAGSHPWYLLTNARWLGASEPKGPWVAAGKLPADFFRIPADANFAQVRKQIPGRAIAAKDVPVIFVSMVPAEIIVSAGPPRFQSIPGTSLQYAVNTDAALFLMQPTGTLYYLVSGRWFSAPSLNGPWAYATPSLPVDFARIPAAGPRGFVLASVPGTPQAQEALIQAQVPQQATLVRAAAKVDVVYAGPPKFEPVENTPMMYAVNTSFDVIRVDDAYFACFQGAWFTAPTPNGPWVLATSIPAVIYTIPPSSPIYRVTYVRIYTSTPTTVTYGYTSGYTMAYVSAGVVVYGTGWYYPPYIYPAPIPIYYPYPYSYSGAIYYNSTTGAWARGGAIYGPYGGVVKGGTAYNPNTGAWASGGAIYGPNGGVGGFSAYNPSTGSYAHGSAVWGPDGASGNASWYNARTGISGSTNQNSDAYGRWGSSTVSGPNQTVHTQSQSNANGSAGSFNSTSGAKGAGVSGANGNRAGVVQGAGGDVYAGADGNVYKKTSDGWSKYDNGSWNQVQRPTGNTNAQNNLSGATRSQTGSGAQNNLSGATERNSAGTASGQARTGASASGASQSFGQLDRDSEARTMGAQRQQQFQSRGASGFEGRGGGGFGGGGGGRFRR